MASRELSIEYEGGTLVRKAQQWLWSMAVAAAILLVPYACQGERTAIGSTLENPGQPNVISSIPGANVLE